MASTYTITSGTYEYTVFVASAGEDCVTVSSGSPIFYNCIFISADGTGLVNQSATTTVKNCICKGTVADASSSADISATSSHNCFVSGATPANFSATGSVLTDPAWVNETVSNYHLLGTSPCIQAGTDVGLSSDLYGYAVGSPPSIGVAEYIASGLIYDPVLFFDIELDGGTQYVATKDFYYNGTKYRGCVIPESFSFSESVPELFYGIRTPIEFSFGMASIDDGVNDTWDELAAVEEFRGRAVKVQLYSDLDRVRFIGYGRINSVKFGTTVSVSVSKRPNMLDAILPRDVVTTDLFHATAKDLGVPVSICFGHCRDVVCPNIRWDEANDIYDFLIGYGTIEGIDETPASNLGVKRAGVLAATSTLDTVKGYYIYDGSAWIRGDGVTEATVYAGYAFIRWRVNQWSHTNGIDQVTADVKGLELGGASANRNFITCIQNLLTNTTWGMSKSIDSTTFTAAATTISNANGFYCDGHISGQRTVESILMDLLMPARAYIEKGSDREWEITVDETGTSVLNAGDGDGHYDNCRVEGLETIPADQIVSKIRLHYDMRDRR